MGRGIDGDGRLVGGVARDVGSVTIHVDLGAGEAAVGDRQSLESPWNRLGRDPGWIVGHLRREPRLERLVQALDLDHGAARCPGDAHRQLDRHQHAGQRQSAEARNDRSTTRLVEPCHGGSFLTGAPTIPLRAGPESRGGAQRSRSRIPDGRRWVEVRDAWLR